MAYLGLLLVFTRTSINRALTPRNTVGVVELPHSTTQYCTSLISDETRGETPKRAGNGMVKIDYRSIKLLGLGRAVRTVRSTRHTGHLLDPNQSAKSPSTRQLAYVLAVMNIAIDYGNFVMTLL
ncbi:Uncharacterized protein HZ326_13400 [Fusarium oxysporum f. sp. albedinis]|nr:Uncharacterized protein HZ326_13400 [Fusarium oxysporum f. sp. albedinis]